MREDELPEELAFRESRLEKIRDAMAALEAEAEAEQAEGKEHRGVPDDKAQRNFTDPQSRIMPALGGRDSLQGYNCQAVVDHYHQVMVAARATILASDKQQAVSMMTETINNTGLAPKEVSAAARLLLGKGDRRFTRFGDGPVRRAGPDLSRQSTAVSAPSTHTQRPVTQIPDAAQGTDQAGSPTLRVAHGNGDAGVRPDQACSKVPAVPTTWAGEGQRGMIADLHRP